MEKKSILITGIGGNVAQGIIRNIRSHDYKFEIIGTDISQHTPGNHLVDHFYQVPYCTDGTYKDCIKDILYKHHVDLLIPATDFEAEVLATYKHELPAIIACSHPDIVKTYNDKYLTYLHHAKYNIPFADSCLPSVYSLNFEKAIAKPKCGRGSRGIIVPYNHNRNLSDDEYLIQKLYCGTEITTAVYVSYKNSKKYSQITMKRTLDNGASVYCEVTDKYDNEIIKIIEKILHNTNIKGSFNIQSIVDESSQIFPFEINARVSGTNFIRAQFGFKDVIYTINELLFDQEMPDVSINKNGVAYRLLSDVIYYDGISKKTKQDNFKCF